MKDKVCIVTGAGSGMGQALALYLAAQGAKVVVTGRTAEKLQKTVVELERIGAESLSFCFDVADKRANDDMAKAVFEKFGRIDSLINNAGHSSKNRGLLETTEAEIKAVIDSNLVGTIYCTQAVIPYMLKQSSGTVMNVSSRSGTHPGLLGGMIYSAVKAAIINFTQFLQDEFKNKGIRFTVVIPGEVNTPILDGRPIPPDVAARESMIPAEAAARAMCDVLALPQSTNIPELQLMPTMLRDLSKEIVAAPPK